MEHSRVDASQLETLLAEDAGAAARRPRHKPPEGVRALDSGRETTCGVKLALSVAEAAGLLGISRTLAYELIAHGDLPHVRLGRRILISRRALEAIIDGTVSVLDV